MTTRPGPSPVPAALRPALAATLLVLLAAAGCDSAGGRLKATPERLYADSLLAPAEELNPDWKELGRQVLAYSVYRKTEHVRRGRAELLEFFKHEARKALKPRGPCSVIAGVAYGLPAPAAAEGERAGKGTKTAGDGKKEPERPAAADREAAPRVLMKVLYLCRQYHALPLKSTDKLPRLPVRGWTLGDDGLAAAEGLSEGGEAAATATGSARKRAGKPAGERAAAPGAGQAPDAPVAADASSPAGTKRERPVKDKEPESVPPGSPPAVATRDGHLYYLAANGLLVKIWSAAPLDAPATRAAVAAVRKRLAASVAVEEKRYRELLATTGRHERKVRVREFWDPNADIYWRLLDFAIGGTIYKVKY